MNTTRAQRRQLERNNAKQPECLQLIPRDQWPANAPPSIMRVFRSRDFLVQEYTSTSQHVISRLSVCRTSISGSRWKDGITWDELQRIKNECGYGNTDAIEIYPADGDVVNVANMRHLWILNQKVPFAWRNRK
jgi:hypothetical protein